MPSASACLRSRVPWSAAVPGSHVRAYDAAADDFIDYGPTDRAAVLTEVDTFLTGLVAEQKLWPGDGLLSPINSGDAR